MSIATLRVLSFTRSSNALLMRSQRMGSRGSMFVRGIRFRSSAYRNVWTSDTWNMFIKPTLFTTGCIGGILHDCSDYFVGLYAAFILNRVIRIDYAIHKYPYQFYGASIRDIQKWAQCVSLSDSFDMLWDKTKRVNAANLRIQNTGRGKKKPCMILLSFI